MWRSAEWACGRQMDLRECLEPTYKGRTNPESEMIPEFSNKLSDCDKHLVPKEQSSKILYNLRGCRTAVDYILMRRYDRVIVIKVISEGWLSHQK